MENLSVLLTELLQCEKTYEATLRRIGLRKLPVGHTHYGSEKEMTDISPALPHC